MPKDIVQPLTSSDCDKLANGYIRNQYSGTGTVPDALISLMVQYVDFWMAVCLTDDHLNQLKQWILDPRTRTAEFPLPPIALGNCLFPCRMQVWCGKHVRLHFYIIPPKEVRYIGGYFHFNKRKSQKLKLNQDSYRRIDDISFEADYIDYKRSEIRNLNKLTLSRYADIRQIQYSQNSHKESFDNLPPLNKYGRYQVLIEKDDLNRLREDRYLTIKDTGIRWGFECYFDDEVTVQIYRPYLPVKVWQMELEVVIHSKIQKNDGETFVFEKRIVDKQYLFPKLDHEAHETGIRGEEIKNASSIVVDVRWEIVRLFETGKDSLGRFEWKELKGDWAEFGIHEHKSCGLDE